MSNHEENTLTILFVHCVEAALGFSCGWWSSWFPSPGRAVGPFIGMDSDDLAGAARSRMPKASEDLLSVLRERVLERHGSIQRGSVTVTWGSTWGIHSLKFSRMEFEANPMDPKCIGIVH